MKKARLICQSSEQLQEQTRTKNLNMEVNKKRNVTNVMDDR